MTVTLADRRCSSELVARARRDYSEMPGTRLTLAQASRLWHAEPSECRGVFDRLIAEGFLYRAAEGDVYARVDGPHWP